MNASAQLLEGVKVLDFTLNLPGPYASHLLASMGAEVVKVEPPKGDPARGMEPFFSLVNRGKKSVVLDLGDEASAEALAKLVRWADVLLEGFRPGVLERLGCGFERARELNPRIVYCSISAFGQEGPRVQEPGHDLNLQALSGVCHLERGPSGSPGKTVLPIADLSTSMAAVASVSAALFATARDGQARHLDVAMADTVLSWAHLWGRGIDTAAQAREAMDQAPTGTQTLLGKVTKPFVDALDRQKLYAMPHYGLYQTGDGGWLALGVVDERHFWEGLCEVLGLDKARKLPLAVRVATSPALRRLIASRLRTRGTEDWLGRFAEAGVPVTPVLDLDGSAAEPQYVARGSFDDQGRVRAPLPGAVHLPGEVPALGEHTESVLAVLPESP